MNVAAKSKGVKAPASPKGPSVVASPTTREASRPAVSTGARSSAHKIDGCCGCGTPGSGRPDSSAMTLSRMS